MVAHDTGGDELGDGISWETIRQLAICRHELPKGIANDQPETVLWCGTGPSELPGGGIGNW